jgi:hypothetical protein
MRQFVIPVVYGVGSGGCRIAASIVTGKGMPEGRRGRGLKRPPYASAALGRTPSWSPGTGRKSSPTQ